MGIKNKIKELIERYTDACSLCTDFDKCEECPNSYFIKELKELLSEK